MTPVQLEAREAWARLLSSPDKAQPLGIPSPWTTPSKGDAFNHVDTPKELLICDRITKTPDGVIWLWCNRQKYPLTDCEPVGLWKKLLDRHVADLGQAGDYGAVVAITEGLDPGQKAAVWTACTEETRERIRMLKDDETESAQREESGARRHQSGAAAAEVELPRPALGNLSESPR